MIKTAITPLTGIRVVELSHMVMGPSTGLLMADLGAEVIKIEPIDGDKTRNLRGSTGAAGAAPVAAPVAAVVVATAAAAVAQNAVACE